MLGDDVADRVDLRVGVAERDETLAVFDAAGRLFEWRRRDFAELHLLIECPRVIRLDLLERAANRRVVGWNGESLRSQCERDRERDRKREYGADGAGEQRGDVAAGAMMHIRLSIMNDFRGTFDRECTLENLS